MRPKSKALPVSAYTCQPTATVSIWNPIIVATRANQKMTNGRCPDRDSESGVAEGFNQD
jgi:hypothetical protein